MRAIYVRSHLSRRAQMRMGDVVPFTVSSPIIWTSARFLSALTNFRSLVGGYDHLDGLTSSGQFRRPCAY
jgi:hypothetical protein